MDKKTLNLTEVAEYLGINRRTLYIMIEDGRFPVQAIKGTDPKRWNLEDVDAWRFSNDDNSRL